MSRGFIVLALAVIGCSAAVPLPREITISGFAVDADRALAARTGTLAALFPSGATGPCWDVPCSYSSAFDLARVGTVKVSVAGQPEIATISDGSGAFELRHVPADSTINVILERPGDTTYIATLDGTSIKTKSDNLPSRPFFICRSDKIRNALLESVAPDGGDGVALVIINNGAPEKDPLSKDLTATANNGSVLYVGFDYCAKSYTVDVSPGMPNHKCGVWLGAILIHSAGAQSVSMEATDTTSPPDPTTGRPYAYPSVRLPLEAKSWTFTMLDPS